MTSDKLKQISLRNEYIHNLTQFISSSKFQIKETLVQLNWSEDRTIFKVSIFHICNFEAGIVEYLAARLF